MTNKQVDFSFSFTDFAGAAIRSVFNQRFLKLNMRLELRNVSPTLLNCSVFWTDPFMKIPDRSWSLLLDVGKDDWIPKISEKFGSFMVDVQTDLRAHAAKKIQAKRASDARARKRRRS